MWNHALPVAEVREEKACRPQRLWARPHWLYWHRFHRLIQSLSRLGAGPPFDTESMQRALSAAVNPALNQVPNLHDSLVGF